MHNTVSKFSWVCCSFPDYLETTEEKTEKSPRLGAHFSWSRKSGKLQQTQKKLLHSLMQKI